MSFVCLECGTPWADRPTLEQHWRASGHGPRQVQADAIDRARFSLLGDAAPPPVDVNATGHVPEHRR